MTIPDIDILSYKNQVGMLYEKNNISNLHIYSYSIEFHICLTKWSPERQKKHLEKLQNQYQDWISNHFTENEETFNKLVEILLQIYHDKQLYDDKESVDIFYSYSEGLYKIRTFEYTAINGEDSAGTRVEDFFNSPLSETVTEAQLKNIFLEKKDYNSNTGRIKSDVKNTAHYI